MPTLPTLAPLQPILPQTYDPIPPTLPSMGVDMPGLQDIIQQLASNSTGDIPREWIDNQWTPEQIVRGMAVLKEQERMRGIPGVNPRDADFFGASNVAQNLDPSGVPLPSSPRQSPAIASPADIATHTQATGATSAFQPRSPNRTGGIPLRAQPSAGPVPSTPSPQPVDSNLGVFGSMSPEQLQTAVKLLMLNRDDEHPKLMEWEQAGWPQDRIQSFLKQRGELLAGEQSINDIRNLRFNGEVGINTPPRPAPGLQPGNTPPDPNAFDQLIKENGPAITMSGQVIPRGISTPGVRQMPMGLGETGYALNDARRTFVPGAQPTDKERESQLLFNEVGAVENLKKKRGYTDLEGEPRPGASAIKTSFGGKGNTWIQNSGAYRPTPEEIAANNAATRRINSNLASTRDVKGKIATDAEGRTMIDAQGNPIEIGDGRPDYLQGLQQRGKRQAFARHSRMGTATPDELIGLLQGLNPDGKVDYTDPAMAQFFPGMAQAQIARGNLANDTRNSISLAGRHDAESDVIRNGRGVPDSTDGNGSAESNPHGAYIYNADGSLKHKKLRDLMNSVPPAVAGSEQFRKLVKDLYGEHEYNTWDANKFGHHPPAPPRDKDGRPVERLRPIDKFN